MEIIRRARGEVQRHQQRVFLCWHPENEKQRVAIKEDLHSHDAGADCVVSWIEDPAGDIDESLLRNELRDSQALVLCVTKESLEAMREDGEGSLPLKLLRWAQEFHTPILPIATYNELLPEFTRLAGAMHGIARSDSEYRTKLKAQLETFLGSEELIKQIREEAFTARVFLSYRKMDIDEARKFMKALHDLEEFVGVSIWYDSFLTAGRDYNQEIEDSLTASDGFVLLVTPNLLLPKDDGTPNYVQETEYPMAAKKQKPVVCVESLATDATRLTKLFPGTEIVIPLTSPAALRAAFCDKLKTTASLQNLDNERAFLLGMAYLRGVGIEKNFDMAIRLLEFAAKDCTESGGRAAVQLANIYEDGIGTGVNYNKALEWWKKVVAYSEQLLGLEHPDTATIYNNIAVVYGKQGDYARALEWSQKALATCEKVLGMEHPLMATTYNNIAQVYSEQGDYARALKWSQKALAPCEKVLGMEHPLTATAYNNIASVYDRQGGYARALEWYRKALAIGEKVLGKEHSNTVKTYNNIALVYVHQGNYAHALEWNQKALATCEKVFGMEHPLTATTYNNIAQVYSEQGDYARALEWFKHALAIFEKVLGMEHPLTATAYNNIASVYNKQGNYACALEWLQKALVIWEKVLGVEHPDTANAYNNIASMYNEQGDYARAMEWHLKALVIWEKVLGMEHPLTATAYNNIAMVYNEQEYYASAMEWCKKALTTCEKALGMEHPLTTVTYENIAVVYGNQGDYASAMEWFQKALTIYEKVLGEEHPDMAGTYNNIAALYYNQGEYAYAQEWFQKALAISEKVFGMKHPNTIIIRKYISAIRVRVWVQGRGGCITVLLLASGLLYLLYRLVLWIIQ